MIRMPQALLLLAFAAPPAWGQAAGSAGDAAAPVAEMAVITLTIMREDLSGRDVFADVGITYELPPGTDCDTVSGDDGVLRCRIPCDPAHSLTKLFQAKTDRRGDYYRSPFPIKAKLLGCQLKPASMTVTYKHVAVALAEADAELRNLRKAEPALPAGILEATASSSEVAAALAAIPEMRKDFVVRRFQKIASNRAALLLDVGKGDVAAQFSAYATAATNVMLADIAKRYSPAGDKTIAKSGKIADFIVNTGKAAALAESRMGAGEVPLDLQVETAAKLADVNQGGKLDGAAQADVYRLWNAHQQFKPVM